MPGATGTAVVSTPPSPMLVTIGIQLIGAGQSAVADSRTEVAPGTVVTCSVRPSPVAVMVMGGWAIVW